ncbi:glycosyltransferase family 2 protein [Nonomuraea africana]|uniref:glycosyltransferase family 2 protein n=1 Tax=Nonomuraea africana TaxID=46171 RepID=UPI0034115911
MSVILTCYNYGHFLGRALESVRGQTFRDLELIVIDDGSVDNSFEVAREFGDAHPDVDMTIVRTRNGGLSRARNLGISMARSCTASKLVDVV